MGRGLSVLLIWMLAGAGAVYWVLKWPTHEATVNVNVAQSIVERGVHAPDIQRILGVTASENSKTSDQSRFKLLGLIASSSGQGSALIAIDGQAPKPYRVGQTVDDGVVLQSLGSRQATLGGGPANGWTLQLPGADKAP